MRDGDIINWRVFRGNAHTLRNFKITRTKISAVMLEFVVVGITVLSTYTVVLGDDVFGF